MRTIRQASKRRAVRSRGSDYGAAAATTTNRTGGGANGKRMHLPREGDRVDVLWDDRDETFRGKIAKQIGGASSMRFHISYDDGDEVVHNLNDMYWRYGVALEGNVTTHAQSHGCDNENEDDAWVEPGDLGEVLLESSDACYRASVPSPDDDDDDDFETGSGALRRKCASGASAASASAAAASARANRGKRRRSGRSRSTRRAKRARSVRRASVIPPPSSSSASMHTAAAPVATSPLVAAGTEWTGTRTTGTTTSSCASTLPRSEPGGGGIVSSSSNSVSASASASASADGTLKRIKSDTVTFLGEDIEAEEEEEMVTGGSMLVALQPLEPPSPDVREMVEMPRSPDTPAVPEKKAGGKGTAAVSGFTQLMGSSGGGGCDDDDDGGSSCGDPAASGSTCGADGDPGASDASLPCRKRHSLLYILNEEE